MDEQKIGALAFRVVGDFGGAFALALGYIGDRLGIFRAMAGAGPLSSEELAQKTGLNERYVREWAKAMVASEYIDYDAATGKFVMTPEQAAVLTNETFPYFVGGCFHFAIPHIAITHEIMEKFKHGGGISYAELPEEVVESIERFWRPGYENFLAKDWLGGVPGLIEKLEKGIQVLDVGCGCGQSSVAMARAYPKSHFTGIDYDSRSTSRAKELAKKNNVSNLDFITAPADQIPAGKKYDLICAFDCIHDMVKPTDTLRAIRNALSPDGVFLWGEPNASDNPVENRNPVGKAFITLSPFHCMTVSLAYGGEATGTVMGEKGARALAEKAGFSRFEKLGIQHPFNQFFACRA
jgi:2-polyprenyl-3-methyl-5-hydroxy-6-metoxy-1,4-benzoquinol methylase